MAAAGGDLDGEIRRLERLSIISKLSQELENHIDINDIDLAEFILHLVEESKDVNDFKNKLSENDADFSDQLIESLYRISCVLLKRVLVSGDKIQSNKNNENNKRKSNNNESELSQIFPVLCLPNVSKSAMDKTKISDQKIADEALDELEVLIGSDNTSKKPKSEANIPPVDKDSKYDRTYKNEPSIGHIYDGIVTKVLEYGCFVRIFSEDTEKVFRDGLVHVSQISQQIFINNARDFIRTGDKIKVKVLSIIDGRLKLSLKDVDQKTGQDIGDDGSESKQHSKLSNEVMYGDEEHWNDDEALRGTNFDRNLNTNRKFINDKATSISNKKFKQDDAFTRFELSQMRHGIIGKNQSYLGSKNNNFDSEKFSDGEDDDYLSSEEDYEVEIIDDIAPFIKKNTRKSILTNLLPVKVLKNPEGSLAKAAQTQVELAKERREKKQERIQQANQQNRNSNPSDSTLSAQDYIDKQAELRQKQFKSENWLDPANNSEAIDSSTGLKNSEVSIIQSNDSDKQHQLLNAEWKKYLPNIYSRKILSQSSSKTSKTILEQRQSLPIYLLRKPLMGAINENNCLIVIGETGSGKTTQITQYLVEEGYVDSKSSGVSSRIACTQPRRVAAISVAKRVAEEIGCSIGQQVGYAIRFEDKTSPETKIKYMTEGMLLRECLVDPELRQYRIIMLDEAHERTISTDVLFGLLKDALRKRTDDLKVIITSATLDAVKFSDYFLQSPIFTIPGRTFPVEIFYSKEQEVDYVEASLTTIMNIHLNEHPGDILVFLTGQEEIDTACEVLHRRIQSLGSDVPELLILPVYGTLPSEMQSRIFDAAPLGSRKVVIATNIAETSLTIDGIYYVVDPGFVKQKVYNSKSGIDQLLVTPISQAQANQRSGRAGRTGPGKCFRLYTEQSYNDEMLPTQVPEIQRSNMSSTVLQLKAMGINDLLNFDFMDPPPAHSLISALEELHALGCIDDEGLLTRLGRRMAEFPLSPMLSKVLIMSVHLECSEEILTIVSMLSVENVFYRPKDKAEIADQKRSQFHCPEGDHLTLLKVFNAWQQHGCSQNWCRANFMHSRTLNQAKDVRKQMLGIMERHHLKIVSCNNDNSKIQRAIVSGYFRNAAKRDSVENGYKTCVDNQLILIHPSSAVFHRNPQWIIYNELVLTTKEYAHNVTVIDPKWLIEFAPSFYKKASLAKMNKARGTQKLNPLFDHRDPEGKEWRISRVHHKSFSKVTF